MVHYHYATLALLAFIPYPGVVQTEPIAAPAGFEPTTLELTALCSAIELRGKVVGNDNAYLVRVITSLSTARYYLE